MDIEPYRLLREALAEFIPAQRLVTDPLRLLTWGGDASFYRLVPKIVVQKLRKKFGSRQHCSIER